MKKKLIIKIFNFYHWTICIHFMIEMGEFVKYYLLTISIRGYNFKKTSSIVNYLGAFSPILYTET